MVFSLEFRLNACPICLICLDCKNKYDQTCTCQARVVEWKRKKIERDYTVDFRQKPLTQQGATKQKVVLDLGFVDWFFAKVSSQIEPSSFHNNVNICRSCISGYHSNNKSMFCTIFFVYKYKVYILIICIK
jgi:hypothetical protein